MAKYQFTVNGVQRTAELRDPDEPMLYVFRNALGLKGVKYGCGLGQCGACTVLMDGEAVRSCQIPASAAVEKKFTTIEGLGTPEKPHAVQAAFIEEQAAQCGYCANGMVMTSAALLAHTPHPNVNDVKQALADNLCRCGTHDRIVKAVMNVAGGR